MNSRNKSTFLIVALIHFFCIQCTSSTGILDFLDDFGAIPNDASPAACQHNSALLARILRYNATHHTLRIPYNYTFHMHHGIYAQHVNHTVIVLDGTLRFERVDTMERKKGHPKPCLMIDRSHNITLTSQFGGLIDGGGPQYWGIPYIGFLETAEKRPRLIKFQLTSNLLIEGITLKDSPYHTLYLEAVDGVEVRNISIVNRRTDRDGHSWIDMSAFNTDGIDVSGHNVHVHDVDIWTQDDCIAVKDNFFHDHGSTNMLFERVNASGLGFVVGSIGGTSVRNITFRDSYLHKGVKGIYLKFHRPEAFWRDRNRTGLVEDVLFENITMEAPTQWPVWIGPAQQADNRNPCRPNPCSLCWPMTPGSECHVVKESKFRNITLRNVQINNPRLSPGVLMGNAETEIEDVTFDNVQVTKGPPLAQSKVELTVTFPGLKQPIVDKYVIGETQSLSDSQDDSFFEDFYGDDWDRSEGMWSSNLVLLSVHPWIMFTCLVVLSVVVLGLFGMKSACSRKKTNEAPESMKEPLLAPKKGVHLDETTGSKRMSFSLKTLVQAVLCLSIYASYSTLPFRKPKWERIYRYFRCQGVVNGVAMGNTWPVPSCFTGMDQSRADVLRPGSFGYEIIVFAGCVAVAIVCIWLLFFRSGPLRRKSCC